MAKLTTTDLTTITGNETSTVASINANFAAVEAAIENTLSRDGTTPNDMDARLDMNNYDLLNVDAIDVQSITIDGISILHSLPSVNPRGDWVTSTSYVVGDLITGDGEQVTYICNTAHTSGTFATDKTSGYWTVFATLGSTIRTPELFSGDGADTTFVLGATPGNEDYIMIFIDGVHQNHDTFSLSGPTITFSEAPPLGTNNIEVNYVTDTTNIITPDGSVTLAKLASGFMLDEDDMVSNSAVNLVSQQSIKAYVDAQVGTVDTLAEVLAIGNTSGGTDLAISAGDDITFTDSSKALFGAGSDLQIYHDGSNSYVTDAGTGDLMLRGSNDIFLSNVAGSSIYGRFAEGSAVSLYHNGSVKFATAATGVTITGEATATGFTGTLDGVLGGGTPAAATVTTLAATGVATVGDGANGLLNIDGGSSSYPAAHFMYAGTSKGFIRGNGSTGGVVIGAADSSTAHLTISEAGNATFAGSGVDTILRIDSQNTAFTAGTVIGEIQLHGKYYSGAALDTRYAASIIKNVKDSVDGTGGSAMTFSTSLNGSGGVTEKLRITKAGNVGIGTTAPANKLEVIGAIVAQGAVTAYTNTGLYLQNKGSSVFDVGAWRSGASAAELTFSTDSGSDAAPVERMRIDSSGNVGIGTASPATTLHVVGDATISGEVTATGFTGTLDGILGGGTPAAATVTTLAATGVATVGNGTDGLLYINGGSSSYPALQLMYAGTSKGFIRGNGSTGGVVIGAADSSTAHLTISNAGNVAISGALSKGSGSFRIAHPLESKEDSHNLVHSFIEGPQADLIYRGRVTLSGGSATVNIDTSAGMTAGTFDVLCRDVQCFTSNESGWTCVRGSVSGATLTIEAEAPDCTDTISWMVVGERKDHHMIDTDWTDENGKVIVEPEKVAEEIVNIGA